MTQSIVAPAPRVRTIKLIQHPAFRGAPVQTDRPHHVGTQPARVGPVGARSADVRPAALPSCPPVPVRRSPATWPTFDQPCLAA